MLEITRERIYGGFAGISKHVYRARVGRNDVATGDTRTAATENAWQQIEASLDCSLNRVHVAVAKDGAVLTCREYETGQYELMFHRADGCYGVLPGGGSEMGGLGGLSAYAMLDRRLGQYNEACGVVVSV